MKLVKRFDGKIEQCDNGGYVSFADYKKLEARLENAAGRERKLEARVKELSEAVVRIAEQRDEQERISISNFEECSKMAAELERLKAQPPIGKVVLGEYDDCGNHPDATVVCLHEQADWEHFQDGFTLFAEPRPAAAVPEWTNEQCLEFLSIAFRHAEISGDVVMDDIRLGLKMVNAGAEVKS